jgi:hypothetical protein
LADFFFPPHPFERLMVTYQRDGIELATGREENTNAYDHPQNIRDRPERRPRARRRRPQLGRADEDLRSFGL